MRSHTIACGRFAEGRTALASTVSIVALGAIVEVMRECGVGGYHAVLCGKRENGSLGDPLVSCVSDVIP